MIGIDSQVQQRMDQFRGRPQDLMQQYQMSRELIDLLALQKLKSEKDAAARSMMMQMQQNPQTIAAQREAELMGRTQQEVAQQVGGIAQLAEARKQQNLQRMASGAQPPVRMAQGGIARFREGGYTPEALGRALRENIADYMEAERENRTPVVRTGRGGERGPSVFERFADWRQENLREAGFADEPAPAPTPAPSAAPMRDLTSEEAQDVAGIDALLQRAAPRDEDVSVVGITPVQAPGLPSATVPNVEPDSLAAVEALRPSMSPEDAQRAAEDRYLRVVDPAEYRRRAEERMGRIEDLDEQSIAAARARLAQLERLDAEQRAASAADPDALAKERRSAFLRGLSGGSSLGYAGGAAGLASIREQQRAQEAARRQQIRDRLQERFGMGAEISAAERQSLMDIMGMQERADVSERDAAIRALDFGQEALRQGSMDRREYAQLFTNLYTNNRSAAVAAMEENARNARTEYEQRMENARATAEMAADSLEARRKYAIDAANARRALLEELSTINSALSMVPEEDRQPELDRLRGEVDQYMAEIDALR